MTTSEASRIKVALVEDDAGLRDNLTALINDSGEFRCVGAFVNAEAALSQIPQHWPDIVVMDINLPQMSGIECVAHLKALRPALHIVMLTVYMDSDLIFKSLMAGASGFLIKRSSSAEILAALSEVHRGGAPMSSAIARKVVEYFQKKTPHTEASSLTKREQEILAHLAKGYRDKEIGDMLSISVPTVRTHVRNIYEKLQVRSRAEAVARYLMTGDNG
jgi:DNA-binding NarL/FixJ family response regulator